MPCLVNVTKRAHGLVIYIYFNVDYNVDLTYRWSVAGYMPSCLRPSLTDDSRSSLNSSWLFEKRRAPTPLLKARDHSININT
jgi:hypothetical protein